MIWYQGQFTKLTETKTSVEFIATNFGSKKFENLEEGKSVNDLKVCETICKRISPSEIFLFPKP